ncbi:hypothetical protein SAMN05444266_106347 [Chitinophaga jiangningensis]|uniref:Polyketide cyclase / dehydrase and lipid transport n=1 Tax=Chitinophaga jiangningensis TaxID=1419482 RepID=A0A1M7FZS2_9BACT|nr:hypothetical protein [Chitinophaga jiangningensis]SHM09612.1 hypothetical protein SAMN05444266_106347 [Chitinophaga jiangningensis]
MKRVFLALKVIAIPVLYALFLRIIFDLKGWERIFSVMTISFLFLVPFVVGAVTIILSPKEKIKSDIYTLAMPWVPITVFFVITVAFGMEGMICWIMALPLFLFASSAGGFIARRFLKQKKNERIYTSFVLILPLLISPIEHHIGAHKKTFKAYTSIDIHADAATIWSQVTRVKAIPASADKGWLTKFMGFPRPVEAVLNYEGVGGYRKAIFTNGLTFHETVTTYIHQQKMVFDIKAHPQDIPAATMDEHIIIGGQFFDVLNGTYELERINGQTYRLHLYSHFTMNTTFNFYAGWWAKWIMKDIQNNILQVEKSRAENRGKI